MSLPRFLVPALPNSGLIALDPTESRHASNVLRMAVGQQVGLFDGRGGEAVGSVERIEKRLVHVRIELRTDVDRELQQPIEVICALPKGDRQKVLVDGLVQMGVAKLVPLSSARAVAKPTGNALARLQRAVIETSKQCGRNRLMAIGTPIPLEELTAIQANQESTHLFAHPYGDSRSLAGLSPARAPHLPARVVIGPEGGFTEDETQSLVAAHWTPISLGPRILRIEIAALTVAAWWAIQQDLD